MLIILSFLVANSHFMTAKASNSENGIINSDTTWSQTGSSYTLTGPVAVNRGVTLTIEPGTHVDLNSYYIQVNGTLIAKGTASNLISFAGGSIAFTSLSKSWDERTGTGSIIQYANFSQVTDQYGNFLNSAAVTIDNASPKITDDSCPYITVNGGSPIISENTGNADLEIDGGTAQVTNNDIWVLTINGASPLIAHNNIGYGLYLNNLPGLEGPRGSPVIFGNNIEFIGREAPSPVVTLCSQDMPVVCDNNITGLMQPYGQDQWGRQTGGETTAYGIMVEGNAFISNNIISGCTKAGIIISASNFAGIPNVTIQNNTIAKGIAITSLVKASVNFNNLQGGVTLSQASSSDVNATYNWWGTNDQAAISNLIYDNKNDFNLGKVSYNPFLMAANSEAVPDPHAIAPQTPESATNTATSTPTQTNSASGSQSPATTAQPNSATKASVSSDWKTLAIVVLSTVVAILAVAVAVIYRKVAKLTAKH